ncbi:hypothetical protein ACDI16_10305 [Oceanobacillus caeni]
MNSRNLVSKTLFYLGILEIVAGLVTGIAMGNTEALGLYGSYTEFSWTIFLICFFSGFIAGLIIIGFSEIIRLLQDIKDQAKGISYE